MSEEARPWDILQEGKRTDPETYRNRFSICQECDKFLHSLNVCSVCGCLMKIKAKIDIAKCPLGKW